ncbi:MAG: NAD(P)H-hydrate dehydratase, partial [bacterium]
MPSPPAPHLPGPLPSHAHKGDAGRVLCIAGSCDMPGAAILSARAAQRAGAGLVTVAHLWSGTLAVVAGACPEALHLDVSAKR